MVDKIVYWLPVNHRVSYHGDNKFYIVWLWQTFPAYIACWKLFFKFFIIHVKVKGLLATLQNLNDVSAEIPRMLAYLSKLGKNKSNQGTKQ